MSLPEGQQRAALAQDAAALVERGDLADIVASLTDAEFVELARTLDPAQRAAILAHASAEQALTVLDLEIWRGDQLDPTDARRFLASLVEARAAVDHPRGSLRELVLAMDPELWQLAIGEGLQVLVIDAEDDQSRIVALDALESQGLATWATPDGFFVVGAPDDEPGRASLYVLEQLYGDDLSAGRALVVGLTEWIRAPIEEEQYRLRVGRLSDLGFPARGDAMRLLRPLAPAAFLEDATLPPATPIDARTATSLRDTPPSASLVRALLEHLPEGRRADAAREILLLGNEVLIAQGFSPGDPAHVELSLAQTHGALTIGTERVLAELEARGARGDAGIDAIAARVEVVGLRPLFRVGYGPLSRLRKAALALSRLFPADARHLAAALGRPLGAAYAAAVHWVPAAVDDGAKVHAIAGLSHLAETTARLGQAAALLRWVFDPSGLGIDAVWLSRLDRPGTLELDDLVRTLAVCWALPGRSGAMSPLHGEDLAWAAANLRKGAPADAQLRAHLLDRAAALALRPELEGRVSTILVRMHAELEHLPRDADDRVDLGQTRGFLTVADIAMWWALARGDVLSDTAQRAASPSATSPAPEGADDTPQRGDTR